MTDEISRYDGQRFPPAQITLSRTNLRSVVGRIAILLLIPIAVLIIALHRSSAAVGGLVAVAIIVLIVALEIPLMMTVQRKNALRNLRGMPHGAIFQGRASLRLSHGGVERIIYGFIILTKSNLRFNPSNTTTSSLVVSWTSVSNLKLIPVSGKIGKGRLIVSLADGGSWTFSLAGYDIVAEILSAHATSH